MPIGGHKQKPVVHELESAVVEGVELTADWNRQLESRVIADYDTQGLFAIAALPEAESIEWCYGCGKCVPVCPVDVVALPAIDAGLSARPPRGARAAKSGVAKVSAKTSAEAVTRRIGFILLLTGCQTGPSLLSAVWEPRSRDSVLCLV